MFNVPNWSCIVWFKVVEMKKKQKMFVRLDLKAADQFPFIAD